MDLSEHRQTRSTRLSDLLDDLDATLRAGDTTDLAAVSTGFPVLDDTIGGGLRAGELILVGGPPGVGKTIVTLQMARNIARAGGHAIFVCYEHEEAALATRLLALEAKESGGAAGAGTSRAIMSLLLAGAQVQRGLADAVASDPGLADALDRVREYAERLTLVRASGAHTGLEQIDELIYEHRDEHMPVVFVDYLQKVPVLPEPSSEAEKVTRSIEHLKDLSLTHHVPIVVISAVDAAGMNAQRLRLHHLRGSSAVAFEADVVVMLNDKMKAVSKVHLAYDTLKAKDFRNWVVFSVEKNRGGPTLIDVEFRKDFGSFRFDPDGGIVHETLVNERLDDAAL